nr:probable pathogenesis-related protein ARB_02861 [Aegilops tauschii subsp. strangulata]
MARTTLLLAAPPPPALPHVLLLLLLLLGTAAADTTSTTSSTAADTTSTTTSTAADTTSTTTSSSEPTSDQQQQQASSPSSSSPATPSSSSPAGAGATPSSSSSSYPAGAGAAATPASSPAGAGAAATTTPSSSPAGAGPASSPAGAGAPPPPPGAGFYKGMSREFVNEHNKVRAKYDAPTLAWDKTLALYARRWAAQIQQDCDQARHSPQAHPLGYGECFFVGNNGTAEDALCSWEREEYIYEKGTKHCTSGHDFRDCGHFVIMIEKTYHFVGCGRAPCLSGPRQGQFFISCNYSAVRPNATTAGASNPS